MHLAGGNYICLQYTGNEVPKDVNFTMDVPKWDNSASSKEDVNKVVKRSFEELKKAVGGLTQAQLDEEVEFFNMKMSRRAVLINMLNYMHEHQGQLIAYSRMNGITPPWSKKDSN